MRCIINVSCYQTTLLKFFSRKFNFLSWSSILWNFFRFLFAKSSVIFWFKTVKIWQIRHARHCGRSRDELINDVLLWTPSHGRAKAGRPARTYVQKLCADLGCSPEDPPEVMDDREGWRERARGIRADCVTWRWWKAEFSGSGQWR